MRVMTFNLWNYNPPWRDRRERIFELLREHSPDAVALQEDRHDFRYERGAAQGEQIAASTGYHHTWALGQAYLPLTRIDEGVSVLSRQEPMSIVSRRLTLFPHDRADENHRVCLGVQVSCEGQSVWVFDTHFSLSAAARRANALETFRFVREVAGTAPAVLMGDLNAEPPETAVRFLVGEEEIDGERGDLSDCWTATYPDDAGYTYASFEPVRRIDYVLSRHMSPPSAAMLVGHARDGSMPSDHLGIIVDLPMGGLCI